MDFDKVTNLPETVERARQRNRAVWHIIDHGNLSASIVSVEETMDALQVGTIENILAAALEDYAVKGFKRLRAIEAEFMALDVEKEAFDLKTQAELAMTALKIALEKYVHAARLYAIEVKDYIMRAKEAEALAEAGEIEVEKAKITADKVKAQAELKEVEAKMQEQVFKNAELPAVLLRRKMEAARAGVRATAASLDWQEEEVRYLEAALAPLLAQAEVATLEADVATLLAKNKDRQIIGKYLHFFRGIDEAQRSVLATESAEWHQKKAEVIYDLKNARVAATSDVDVLASLLKMEAERRSLGLMEVYQHIAELGNDVLAYSSATSNEHTSRLALNEARLATLTAKVQGDAALSRAHARVRTLIARANAEVKKDEANTTWNTTTNTNSTSEITRTQESIEYISGGS